MEYQDFLKRLPKVDLHVHLMGTIRPETLVELATKHGVALPTTDPARLYAVPYTRFAEVLDLVCSVVSDHDDLVRVTYESLEDGVNQASLRHCEMSFNPTRLDSKLSYPEMVDAMIEGVAAAEENHGVTCRLIPSISRRESPERALGMVREVIENPRDEVVGIGMDGPEAFVPPELFAEAFTLAREAGLRTTAHVGEDGPAHDVATCLDVLGCDRLDHAYSILEDPALVARVRSNGVFLNVNVRGRARYSGFRHHPVREMAKAGLGITVGSDHPTLQQGDLNLEYVDAAWAFNWGLEKMVEVCMNGVRGSWLDEPQKMSLGAEFETEISTLRGMGVDDGPPAFMQDFRGKWWSPGLDFRNLDRPLPAELAKLAD